jgi:hypothetical protein
MPEYPVELRDPAGAFPDGSLTVRLDEVPKRGSWFDLGDGLSAQVKDVRAIGGEPVIFAGRKTEPGRGRLRGR